MLCQGVTIIRKPVIYSVRYEISLSPGRGLEEHTCRAAFTVGPSVFWEFTRLFISLNNAPATSRS